MLNNKKKIFVFLMLVIVAGFLYVFFKINYGIGSATSKKTVLVEKGDNALVVGEKLSKAGIVDGKYLLVFYLWKEGDLHKLVAGVYDFSVGLKIPEIASIITGGQVAMTRIPITFPEGLTLKQMAEKISANGFSGDEFLSLVNSPSQSLRDKYVFLKEIPEGKSMEGYLFPDTYYFAKDASSVDIVEKMLKNFEGKITQNILDDIAVQKKSLYEIITMASIIEGEVAIDADRKIVAGLFWNRLATGMTLGSDATLEYVLGGNKRQHSIAETKTDSPYNTYLYKGLPPGPVSNPGISSIMAAVYPQASEYMYFLSDPKTGKTIFSKTFQEHVANKDKYGL